VITLQVCEAIHPVAGALYGPPSVIAHISSLLPELGKTSQESFWVLPLNHQLRPGELWMLALGTSNATLVDVRELFRRLLLDGASSFIIFHNHPSGSTDFSPEDIALTQQIAKGAKILGLALSDHILSTWDHRRDSGVWVSMHMHRPDCLTDL